MKHFTSHKTSTASYSPAHEYTSSQILHIYGVSVVICGGLPARQAASNDHNPPLKHRKYTDYRIWNDGYSQKHRAPPTRLGHFEWAISDLDKIVTFYQHTNNYHLFTIPNYGGGLQWFAVPVVCGGLWWFACIVSGFTVYRPNSGGGLRWCVVVCGGLWWFMVVCGGLRWFVLNTGAGRFVTSWWLITDWNNSPDNSGLLWWLSTFKHILACLICIVSHLPVVRHRS